MRKPFLLGNPQMVVFIAYLNEGCYAGIAGYEFHYSFYEIKKLFFRKHLDLFQDNSCWQFSLISYLNPEWKLEHGGELSVFQNEIRHDVWVTQKPRLSITGWLKR